MAHRKSSPLAGTGVVFGVLAGVALYVALLMLLFSPPADAAPTSDAGVRPVVIIPDPEPIPASLLGRSR